MVSPARVEAGQARLPLAGFWVLSVGAVFDEIGISLSFAKGKYRLALRPPHSQASGIDFR